jgi:hypothetical protein
VWAIVVIYGYFTSGDSHCAYGSAVVVVVEHTTQQQQIRQRQQTNKSSDQVLNVFI